MADFHLDWRGDELKRTIQENGAKIISEFALTVEGEAKKLLRKSERVGKYWVPGGGRGVRTGTLRRSIHTALTGYDWGGDDVEPGPGTPERGGEQIVPDAGEQATVQVGSGLVYAMAVHQGHHSFAGHHYLTNGLNKAKGKLSSIIARHKVQR